MKKIFSALLALIIILSFCFVQKKNRADKAETSIMVSSMDTVMKLSAYGEKAAPALALCEAEILRLNDLLSIGIDSSEISQVNRHGRLTLSEDTAFLVERALELFESTDGAFDITVAPLAELWGFPSKEYYVPTDAEIEGVLQLIGSEKISYDATTHNIALAANQAIDLGGIAKGYTSQRLMKILSDNGVKSALVSLGGNVQCLGSKPDGNPWRIGIQNPWNEVSGVYAVVSVKDEAVITSGGYERFFEDPASGKVYKHILDSTTGYPVESGLASVSIVTKDGTLGDGLSTALYVMGFEKAVQYWHNHTDAFEMILILDDGSLYASAGLQDRITSSHKISIIN